MVWSAVRLPSRSSLNAPQLDASAGISVRASQPPLTKRKKSSCGRTERSKLVVSIPSASVELCARTAGAETPTANATAAADMVKRLNDMSLSLGERLVEGRSWWCGFYPKYERTCPGVAAGRSSRPVLPLVSSRRAKPCRDDKSCGSYGFAAHPFTLVHWGSSGGRLRRPSSVF